MPFSLMTGRCLVRIVEGSLRLKPRPLGAACFVSLEVPFFSFSLSAKCLHRRGFRGLGIADVFFYFLYFFFLKKKENSHSQIFQPCIYLIHVLLSPFPGDGAFGNREAIADQVVPKVAIFDIFALGEEFARAAYKRFCLRGYCGVIRRNLLVR